MLLRLQQLGLQLVEAAHEVRAVIDAGLDIVDTGLDILFGEIVLLDLVVDEEGAEIELVDAVFELVEVAVEVKFLEGGVGIADLALLMVDAEAGECLGDFTVELVLIFGYGGDRDLIAVYGGDGDIGDGALVGGGAADVELRVDTFGDIGDVVVAGAGDQGALFGQGVVRFGRAVALFEGEGGLAGLAAVGWALAVPPVG